MERGRKSMMYLAFLLIGDRPWRVGLPLGIRVDFLSTVDVYLCELSKVEAFKINGWRWEGEGPQACGRAGVEDIMVEWWCKVHEPGSILCF